MKQFSNDWVKIKPKNFEVNTTIQNVVFKLAKSEIKKLDLLIANDYATPPSSVDDDDESEERDGAS